jgi:Mn2+/Fe2+ NRAMP family transporter
VKSANNSGVGPHSPAIGPSKQRLWRTLGAGLIAGAADDDPSGIATYSQAGAQFGFALAWTLLLTYPLMVAIQTISARIGRTTGRGIAGSLRLQHAGWTLILIIASLFIANTCNIGADLIRPYGASVI